MPNHPPPIITDEMRRFVAEQRLGFVATVNPDGTPNLSPKGSVRVFDERHLIFADIRSPQTVRNIDVNTAVEVNVVDVAARAGYRFAGNARVHRDGAEYAEGLAFLRSEGVTSEVQTLVKIRVARAMPIASPSYDSGATRDELIERWAPSWSDTWLGIPLLHVVRGDYEISSDRARLDVPWVTAMLARSYWAANIPEFTMRRAIAGSLCFGIYRDRQVGFARIVTDYATFAWLADVIIDPEHRGRGLGTWLTQVITTHPSLHGLRRWLLATRDAHAIYATAAFKPLAAPQMFMERHDPKVYERGEGDSGDS